MIDEKIVIAHRGAMSIAPENTGASFDIALLHPIDGFETDIQMTKDDRLVIFHDRTTSKLESCPRNIAEISFSDFLCLDCGAWFSEEFKNQKILTLDGFIEKYLGSSILMLELKSYPGDLEGDRRKVFLDILYTTINRYDHDLVKKNIFILSFDESLLKDFSELMPDIRFVMNLETDSIYFKDPLITPSYISALCMDIGDLDIRFVSSAKERGVKVYTYSCQCPSTIKKAFDLNLDGIMTDNPEAFFRHLKNED